jgi:hypothetical protein
MQTLDFFDFVFHGHLFQSEAFDGLSAASVLGGEPVLHALPRSALEWIALVRQGIQPIRWMLLCGRSICLRARL